MSISVDSRFTIHFCSTECPQSFIQQVEADNWVRSVTVHPGHLSFQSHSMFPGQTAAVAVVSLSASDKLRCRTLELVMVSKWLSGTHPRCRSDSLVPSTQSGKEKETDIKKLNAVTIILPLNTGKGSVVVLRSLLCWCTRITSAFSNDSSSGCWATHARIHCICAKSVGTKKKEKCQSRICK